MPKLSTLELKAIQVEAHKIRAKTPGKKWQRCVAEAGRKIRK